MPWSNQSGGGRKGGGGGPWGQGPSGPHQQPDLEELLKRSQDRLKQVMPGGTGVPSSLLFLGAVVLAAVVAFFAFTFTVRPDELGVVMRFGKVDRQEAPGLHFRLPYPIEEVRLPKVTRQNIIEIGMRTALGTPQRRARCPGGEPDADRRREHRRRRLRRLLAHQGCAEDTSSTSKTLTPP